MAFFTFKVKLNDLKMDPSSPVLPANILEQTALQLGCSPTDKELAFHLDEEDELKHLRQCFFIPKVKDLPPSKNCNYSGEVGGKGGVLHLPHVFITKPWKSLSHTR